MTEAAISNEFSVSFGPFRLLPRQRLLTEAGQPVRLGSRALEILATLAEARGELVTKEALLARVWPHTHVVEDNLTVHVSALRRALRDGAGGRRFIVTVPGRGYALVAQLGAVPEKPPAPARRRAPSLHNLPMLATRIIGRTAVLPKLVDRLAQHRLLTLVGPGGIGKTTLALAIAEALVGRYADGIWLVDLATITEPRDVAAAVAAVLGIPADAGDALKRLSTALFSQQILIVLDNCEHLIEATAELVESLSRTTPGMTVLATSREALGLAGEQIYRLGPLASPPAGAAPSAADALGFPAVELFVERVAAQKSDFSLSDAEAPGVGEICRRLDGIPLAIELAASLVNSFGLAGLGQHLQRDLGLIAAGRRSGHAHQKTLAHSIEWSYRLLSRREQALLRRLSVFENPFTMAAACAVAAGNAVSDEGVTRGVIGLIRKSLIIAEPSDGAMRYRLLEPIRMFAVARLMETVAPDPLD